MTVSPPHDAVGTTHPIGTVTSALKSWIEFGTKSLNDLGPSYPKDSIILCWPTQILRSFLKFLLCGPVLTEIQWMDRKRIFSPTAPTHPVLRKNQKIFFIWQGLPIMAFIVRIYRFCTNYLLVIFIYQILINF